MSFKCFYFKLSEIVEIAIMFINEDQRNRPSRVANTRFPFVMVVESPVPLPNTSS